MMWPYFIWWPYLLWTWLEFKKKGKKSLDFNLLGVGIKCSRSSATKISKSYKHEVARVFWKMLWNINGRSLFCLVEDEKVAVVIDAKILLGIARSSNAITFLASASVKQHSTHNSRGMHRIFPFFLRRRGSTKLYEIIVQTTKKKKEDYASLYLSISAIFR